MPFLKRRGIVLQGFIRLVAVRLPYGGYAAAGRSASHVPGCGQAAKGWIVSLMSMWKKTDCPSSCVLPIAAFLLVVCHAGCVARNETQTRRVGMEDALGDLTNVARLSCAPAGTMNLISSRDPSGGNTDWADLDKYRAGSNMYVLANLKGPGILRRVWKTYIVSEKWLFFVDDREEPVLAVDGEGFFGKSRPFEPPLCEMLSGGDYSYFPIPFQRSLRIAVRADYDRGMMPFFQLGYEQIPDNALVNSLVCPLPDRVNAQLESVLECWKSVAAQNQETVQHLSWSEDREALPRTQTDLLTLKGPAVINALCLVASPLTNALTPFSRRFLREAVLVMNWDGQREASVEVPVGDFFCNGTAVRKFDSLLVSVGSFGLLSRFPMPFRRSARISLRNDGARPFSCRVGFSIAAGDNGGSQTRYFHATWNASTGTAATHTVLDVSCEGHYAGTYLIAMGFDGSWNILEGDERMLVDGNLELSGTGLEDYFNGGWYYRGLFARPLHGLLDKAPVRTSQYRFHLPDPVGFRKRFRMTWELGSAGPMNRASGYMSSVAYWYAAKPMPSGSRIPPVEQRFPPTDPLERQAIMCALFELERTGRYDEALEQCKYYCERFKGTPEAEIIELRSVGYKALLSGFESTRTEYQKFLSKPLSHVSAQAKTIMWRHENSSNVLIAANANGDFKVWLDGKDLLGGDHPLVLYVRGAVLQPGMHEICAEVTAPDRPGPHWLAVTIEGLSANLHTDLEWECSLEKPSGWPATDDPSVEWGGVVSQGFPPYMAYWQFFPNAFVNVQSGERYIAPAKEWKKGAKAYFRKKFVSP